MKRISGREKEEKDEWWEELPLDTKRRIKNGGLITAIQSVLTEVNNPLL